MRKIILSQPGCSRCKTLADMLGYNMTKQEIYDLVLRIECDILLLVFVILKLTEHIDWAWWSIFTPVYVLYIINMLKIYLKKSYKKE